MKNALLVIDVQNIYKNGSLAVDDSAKVVNNINGLINHFNKSNNLVIYIKHIHKADKSDMGRMFDFSGKNVEDIEFVENTPDVQFIPELNILKNAPVIIKNRYSSFVNTNLDNILKQNNIDRVTICGFMTNLCCEMTARHAHDLDYFVDFVVDATGTPGTEDLSPDETIKATAATLGAGCAKIITTIDAIR